MKRTFTGLAMLCLIVASLADCARAGVVRSEHFPDTPHGRCMQAFIDMLNSDDPADCKCFLDAYYSDEMKTDMPEAESPDMLASMQKQLKPAVFQSLEDKGNASYSLIIETGKRRSPFDVQVTFLGEDSPLISDLIVLPKGMKLSDLPGKRVSRATQDAYAAAKKRLRSAPGSIEQKRILQDLIEQLAAADEFSGAVLLARNGETLFSAAAGEACKRYDVPNRIDTKFNLGSMNKMFTAVAIAQLVEQGKLSYDDRVADLLPDYPNLEMAEKVKVRHLLSHTSGMGSYWTPEFRNAWHEIRTVEEIVPFFLYDPLEFEPGAEFGYSNSGFIVLGLIIEELSDLSYYDYVREKIFLPCGMLNTDSYEMDRPVANLALGYLRPEGDETGPEKNSRRNNLFMHTLKGGPAGGGYSTVEDLLRFQQALTNNNLIRAETLAEMLRPQGPKSRGRQYGFGFMIEKIRGKKFYGHTGGAPGINAYFMFSPESGSCVCALANYDDATIRLGLFLAETVSDL